MTLKQENAAAAAAHVKVITGPTIMMGDGSYFDFIACDASEMTIEDYAWGLLSANRFRGQTRISATGRRCLYTVLQHVCIMARQMLRDCQPMQACFEGLMHESDEVVWGDFPGPAKALMGQDFKDHVARAGKEIDARFGVTSDFKDVVKYYDIRMLATEKRDLMPHSWKDQWQYVAGYPPMDYEIVPWAPDHCLREFMGLYHLISEGMKA